MVFGIVVIVSFLLTKTCAVNACTIDAGRTNGILNEDPIIQRLYGFPNSVQTLSKKIQFQKNAVPVILSYAQITAGNIKRIVIKNIH